MSPFLTVSIPAALRLAYFTANMTPPSPSRSPVTLLWIQKAFKRREHHGLRSYQPARDSRAKRERRTASDPILPGTTWQHKTPSEAGINPQLLKEAIDFAIASETKAPRDLVLNHYETFGREPFGEVIGPIKDRGDPTGLIIRHGYLVAEWGDPLRVDMSYSVTKSFLSSVVGIAVDRGMIKSINDTVRDYIAPIQVYNPFPSGNKADGAHDPVFWRCSKRRTTVLITWDNLLRQTSDWEGTLWGKPDWADRPGPTRRNGRHEPQQTRYRLQI